MAEAILFNVAASIITKLGSPALQQAKLWWGVNDDLQKLKTTVSTIQAVLLDAEEQYSQSRQVKVWVDSLKQAFYDADDLLDEFCTKALQERVMTGNKIVKEVRLFFSCSNPIAYSLKMAHKIKNIRSKLDAIVENKKFQLEERHQRTNVMGEEKEESHSSLPKVVIGREDDKNKIIECLLSSNYRESVSIISIVGIGGLGKTTLAQLVCDDERVKSNFDIKLWVCVSDNFDLKAIVEKILESVGEKPAGNCQMNTLKNLLLDKINGRKYLLVLDDVWNECYEKWFRLKDLLDGGANGSRMIVTTRLQNVAEGIRSDKIYKLEGLVEAESWSLFKNMAFREGQLPSSEYEGVGKDIVAKCVGVPLAIRVIGRLLFFKNTISEWQNFKDKELSSIHKEAATILSTLRLSFHHLPSHLKYCFAYCSLFPKDTNLSVQALVHCWVAQGYIKSLDSELDLENIGLKYFKELLWRSFFEEVEEDPLGNIRTCKMHDLMCDLAVSVAGEENTLLNSDAYSVNEVTRHLSLGLKVSSSQQLALMLPSVRKVRNLLLFSWSGQEEIKEDELHAIFSNLRRLRVLSLADLRIEKVPPSIDRLKHIRFLDLSYNNGIEILPDSITKLQNLQTLWLTNCERLKQLPKHFKRLINLRQLYNEGCVSLNHMPRGLGQLTSLRDLEMFIVAKDNGVSKQSGGLDELHDLNNLRGDLGIYNLRYVKNAAFEFEAANLKEKKHLQYLELSWKLGKFDDNTNRYPDEVGNDNKELSIEELRPHLNLKWLVVFGCGRLKFPSWISSLTNLVKLKIDDCKKCQSFPPLDQFAFLKTLMIENFTDLEYIESAHNQMSGSELFFPSLEKLWLWNCPNLKGWWRRSELLQFHCLVYLDIQSCPNLTSMPLIPSVETLVVENVSMKSLEDVLKMKISVTQSNSSSSPSPSSLFPALSELRTLAIHSIEGLESLAEELMQNLTSLQKLEIVGCPKIKILPRALQHLTSLKVLLISDCDELDFSNENESGFMQWDCLRSLEQIQFKNMPKLVSLPKGLQCVPALCKLFIKSCPNLICLPEWMPNLTTLRLLSIENCPQLSGRCSSNMGMDWPKMAHVPDIWIDDRYIQYKGCNKL